MRAIAYLWLAFTMALLLTLGVNIAARAKRSDGSDPMPLCRAKDPGCKGPLMADGNPWCPPTKKCPMP